MTDLKTGIENRKKELKEFWRWIIGSKKRAGIALASVFIIVVGIAGYIDPPPEPPNYNAAVHSLSGSSVVIVPFNIKMDHAARVYRDWSTILN